MFFFFLAKTETKIKTNKQKANDKKCQMKQKAFNKKMCFIYIYIDYILYDYIYDYIY